MMSKTYYIVESRSGALGATGDWKSLKLRFTDKKKCEIKLNKIKALNKDNKIVYWMDFYWNK